MKAETQKEIAQKLTKQDKVIVFLAKGIRKNLENLESLFKDETIGTNLVSDVVYESPLIAVRGDYIAKNRVDVIQVAAKRVMQQVGLQNKNSNYSSNYEENNFDVKDFNFLIWKEGEIGQDITDYIHSLFE